MREIDWFVFFLCTLLNVIILLNMLVAIISETFGAINETKVETSYREKVVQILNMQVTLYGINHAEYRPTELLFIAKATSAEDMQSEDDSDKINEIQQHLNTLSDTVNTHIADSKHVMDQLIEMIDNIFDAIRDGTMWNPPKGTAAAKAKK